MKAVDNYMILEPEQLKKNSNEYPDAEELQDEEDRYEKKERRRIVFATAAAMVMMIVVAGIFQSCGLAGDVR